MSILTLIVVIVLIGLVLWLVNTYIPMQPVVKNILNIVVIILLLIFILKGLGVWTPLAKAKL